MIDLHCHIIPDVDDGSGSLEESLEMARLAVSDGITHMVATPHTLNGVSKNTTAQILQAVDDLKKAFAAENIPLTLHTGSEIHFTGGLRHLIRSGDLCTLNNRGKYALLELPSQSIPAGLKQEIFELKLDGITPIIAHPERHVVFQNEPDSLRELIDMGAMAQLTAMSLLGDFGPLVRQAAKRFLEMRLVQIMASDGHSAERRPPLLSRAVEEAADVLKSLAEAQAMVTERPAAVLAGTSFDFPQPSHGQPKRTTGPFKRISRLWRARL